MTNRSAPSEDGPLEDAATGPDHRGGAIEGRIGIVVAFTGRIGMVDLALRHMAARFPAEAVFCYVGSTDEDTAWAEGPAADLGDRFAYRSHPNTPLGDKWARGVDLARGQDCDVVAITGSDDILSERLVQLAVRCLRDPLNDGINMVAPRSWYLYEASGTGLHLGSAFRLSYPASARRISLGAGRVYSRRLLDRVDWQIFDTSKSAGLDDLGQKLAAEAEIYYASAEEAPVLSVKGPWAQMNDTGKLFGSGNIRIRALSPWEKSSMLRTKFDFADTDLTPLFD